MGNLWARELAGLLNITQIVGNRAYLLWVTRGSRMGSRAIRILIVHLGGSSYLGEFGLVEAKSWLLFLLSLTRGVNYPFKSV